MKSKNSLAYQILWCYTVANSLGGAFDGTDVEHGVYEL
jgi:hypothetical protein